MEITGLLWTVFSFIGLAVLFILGWLAFEVLGITE
jgi:hypothetical protein